MDSNNLLTNVITKIVNNYELDDLMDYCEKDIYINGPINTSTLEILSIMKDLQYDFFKTHETRIIRLMGLFFKDSSSEISDLQQLVMEDYKKCIKEIRQNKAFTPMQNEIITKIENNDNYSFSSPTSTGKSYIFRYLIENAVSDIMIVVPSRALINEFYINIMDIVHDKDTMILTFVDNINKKHTKKRIFILTPERDRDVFKFKNEFNFQFFLFDEAQLTNEKDERGMYYDGIVRRLKKSFPSTKFIFAHPFIKNPEAQFQKNNFKFNKVNYDTFLYKNTGQLFICKDDEEFYLFGTNKKILGERKVKIEYDPIERVLEKKGSILIYTAKSRIIKQEIAKRFEKYINRYCNEEPNPKMLEIINLIKPYIGASDKNKSYFIEYLKKGIVFHHGSMPLDVRILLEKYIKLGFCKICFATSTLAQGVNMPFDLIYIDKFEKTKQLQLRNIIGRAGRSSNQEVFDYGLIVVKKNNMSDIREIINYEEKLNITSQLDTNLIDEDKKEYRDAIKNNDFSDEFNLPNVVVDRMLNNQITDNCILNIKNSINYLVDEENNKILFEILNDNLTTIYNKILLPKRDLNDFEKGILKEANRLMLKRYKGLKFSQCCISRYSRVTKKDNSNYKHGFIPKFAYIPNTKFQKIFNLFGDNEKIDYDTVVYDTYDYFDKLIDLKVGDIYYAAFMKYYEKTKDEKVRTIAIKLKYGTSDSKQIMELRYGFTSDDFDWLDPVVSSINDNEIIFNDRINQLDEFKMEKIKKFI